MNREDLPSIEKMLEDLDIDLERAVRALTPGQRAALLYIDLGGYTEQDIATAWGCSRANVCKQLAAAKKNLGGRLTKTALGRYFI